MHTKRPFLCGAIFTLLCMLTFSFLHYFTIEGEPPVYLSWENVTRQESDGTFSPISLDEHGIVPGMEDGGLYHLEATVENVREGYYLQFYTDGASYDIAMNGQTLFKGESAGNGSGLAQVPLPSGSGTIELTYRVTDPSICLYPPIAYITSTAEVQASTMAYANLLGIPAGAFGVIFLLLSGLFLIGIALKRTDFTLLLPIAGTALLATTRIAQSAGYYFLPQQLTDVLILPVFRFVIPILLVIYLLANRKRGAIKELGWMSLFAGLGLLVATLWSYFKGTYLANYLIEQFRALAEGTYYDGLLYWLTMYLVFATTAITLYDTTRDFINLRTESRLLAVKNQLVLDNYHSLQRKNEDTADLRHEWKNQMTALQLMLERENYAGAQRYLGEMNQRLNNLIPRSYTDHFLLNTLLQYADGLANAKQVAFHAQVSVPKELTLPEEDLCTLFLNLFDNAIEAASHVESAENRFVRLKIHLVQGFLAIKCENSFNGTLLIDENGHYLSTKEHPDKHGLGIKQMRQIADKYSSTLDISYTDDVFTIQTALKV